MARKRNKLEIIRDMLKVINSNSGKIKPTHIMYKSNLSHQVMEGYLKELISKDFISEVKSSKGKSYSINEKGLKYLKEYRFIIEFADSFGLNF